MEETIDQSTVNADNGEVATTQTETSSETEQHEEQHQEQSQEQAEQDEGEKESAAAEQKPVQDAETNSKFAEMRRQKEAAEKAKKQVDDWVKTNYGDRGLTTWEEYQNALREEEKRKEYESRGIDYDEVRKIAKEEADNHPDVVRAKNDRILSGFNSEIAELTREFPDIKISAASSLEDISSVEEQLAKLPNWDKIQNLFQRGYTLADAYEKANREDIRRKQQEATRQATLNNTKGKEHMRPNGGEGADIDAIIVPDDVMQMYRQMFKKQLRSGTMKESDFAKHYKQSMKGAK